MMIIVVDAGGMEEGQQMRRQFYARGGVYNCATVQLCKSVQLCNCMQSVHCSLQSVQLKV